MSMGVSPWSIAATELPQMAQNPRLVSSGNPLWAKARVAAALLRRKAGMRYTMNAIGLDADARAVCGSHGRLPGDPRDESVLICTDPAYGREGFAATEVKYLLLCLAGLAG